MEHFSPSDVKNFKFNPGPSKIGINFDDSMN